MRGLSLGILMLASVATAAAEHDVPVTPANATACLRSASEASPRDCVDAKAGKFRFVTAAAAGSLPLIVDLSAPLHFEESRSLDHILATGSIALTPYPRFSWTGWDASPQPETRAEWLPVGTTQWRDLGSFAPGAAATLDGEVAAIRLIPDHPAASPQTRFPATARSGLILQQLALERGGELALCLNTPQDEIHTTHRVTVEYESGTAFSGETDLRGCIAFAGLEPGKVIVDTEAHALVEGPAIVSVAAGRSEWLGLRSLEEFGKIVVRLLDSQSDRSYTTQLHPAQRDPAVPVDPPRRIIAGDDSTWSVSAGAYVVVAVPESEPDIEIRRNVVVEPGELAFVEVRPEFVTVEGTVWRGSTPLAESRLRFSSTENVSDASVSTRTDSSGQYEARLPRRGLWSAFVTSEGQRSWRPLTASTTVPDVERFRWDIELPDGVLQGRVVHGGTRRGLERIGVNVTWRSEDGSRGLITTRTNPEGGFRVDSLPEATVTVEVPDDAARPLGLAPASVIVDISESAKDVELVLEPTNTGARLELVDAAGRAAAYISAYSADGSLVPRFLGVSNGLGELDVPAELSLPSNLYLVGRGYPWHRVTVSPPRDGERQRVALPPAHLVMTRILIDRSGSVERGSPEVWSLEDDLGLRVPLLHHLLAQGHPIEVYDGALSIPLAGSGIFRLWVNRADESPQMVGTIVLPGREPIVLGAN